MIEPVRILVGDVLEGLRALPEGSVQCCVTSPPYWGLRDYGVDGQIGLEATPEDFLARLVEVFRAVRRVLREDGTLWLNIGDSYSGSTMTGGNTGINQQGGESGFKLKRQFDRPQMQTGLKNKDLCLIPWRLALALQADGWYLRSVICWHKRSPMPESCRDRPTSAWEPIFLLAKSERYYYDAEAVKEKSVSTGGAAFGKVSAEDEARAAGQGVRRYERPDYREIGRNMRNVWTLSSEPYKGAHFATFPTEIPRRAILAGTSERGCCPACGAGWVRKTEAWYENPGNRSTNGAKSIERQNMPIDGAGFDVRLERRSRTIGWEPGCACDAGEPVPCVVLDPFLGSGTTVAVARELGRHGVGCELNPQYAEMARERIARAERPLTSVRRGDGPGELWGLGEVAEWQSGQVAE